MLNDFKVVRSINLASSQGVIRPTHTNLVNESARREDTWMRGCRLTRTDGKGVLSVKEFRLEGGLRLEEEPLDEKMIDVIED
jgi:hypothetical protein